MITFEEFADAYAATVPKILAKMKYLERIEREALCNEIASCKGRLTATGSRIRN